MPTADFATTFPGKRNLRIGPRHSLSAEYVRYRQPESRQDLLAVDDLAVPQHPGLLAWTAHRHRSLPGMEDPDQRDAERKVLLDLLVNVLHPIGGGDDLDHQVGRELREALLLLLRRHPIGADEGAIGRPDRVGATLQDVAAVDASHLAQSVLVGGHDEAGSNTYGDVAGQKTSGRHPEHDPLDELVPVAIVRQEGELFRRHEPGGRRRHRPAAPHVPGPPPTGDRRSRL